MNIDLLGSITTLLGWALATVAILTAWPQAIRLIRTRNTDGVDARTAGFATLTMVAWTGYTVRLGDVPAAVSSIGPLLAWVTTLSMLVLLRDPRARRTLLWVVPASAAIGVLATTSSWGWVGALAAAGSAGWAIPQLRTAMTSRALGGVSIVAYSSMAAENLGWIVYAILTGTPAYLAGAVIQGPATALIALKAARSQRRVRVRAAHPSMFLRSPASC